MSVLCVFGTCRAFVVLAEGFHSHRDHIDNRNGLYFDLDLATSPTPAPWGPLASVATSRSQRRQWPLSGLGGSVALARTAFSGPAGTGRPIRGESGGGQDRWNWNGSKTGVRLCQGSKEWFPLFFSCASRTPTFCNFLTLFRQISSFKNLFSSFFL